MHDFLKKIEQIDSSTYTLFENYGFLANLLSVFQMNLNVINMLIEFKVANFRSIREEQSFSLVAGNADKNLPSCVIERKLPGLAGVKYLKGAAIYGANASGKSNIIAAMHFMTDFVRRSATEIKPGGNTGVRPFKLDNDSQSKPSVFEVTFVVDQIRFVFGFSTTLVRVVEEYLVAYPRGVPQRWYHRIYNEEKGSYDWEKSASAFKEDKSLQDKTRENALFLSVAPQFNHIQLRQVFDWFAKDIHFLHLNIDAGIDPTFTATLMSSPAHHDRLMSLLQSADIGVSDAKVTETEVNFDDIKDKIPPAIAAHFVKSGAPKIFKNFEISLMHKVSKDLVVPLDFENEESAGTRRFFSLIGPWIDILENGHTVFIDEIEASLHPILVKELLKLLFCNKNNPKGAQVVFTTHNPVLLDGSLMRRDQIWFTEKSLEGTTHLYPLTDYRPRKDEALARGYLAGRYGAVPFIPEGLKP